MTENRATVELVCGRCENWLMRWTADLTVPFDEQRIVPEVPAPDIVLGESPAAWLPTTSDDEWYQIPRRATSWADGEIDSRHVFVCVNKCTSNVQARWDKLRPAAMAALRYLHDTQTPLLRTTVDKLLKFVS